MSNEWVSPMMYSQTAQGRRVETEKEKMGIGGKRWLNSCPHASSALLIPPLH